MKVLNKIIETILAIIVAVMVIGCIWQVFTRFVLNDPSKYTEELLKDLLIWLTMLGVPYAYGQNKHLSVNLVTNTFTKKNTLLVRMGIEVLAAILAITVMIIGGIKVTLNAVGQSSAALQLPMQFYYICIPICGVLMLVYCAEHMVKLLKQWKEEK